MCRARVRSEADLGHLHLPDDIQPGQQLVIKQIKGTDYNMVKQLAEQEAEVLKCLRGKDYVPRCYGLYPSLEADAADVTYCGNLVIG